jgi:hypothetical protein
MNRFKSIAVLSCLAFIGMMFVPSARADVWNQATKLHFSQPVETPAVTLPAGTYWFVLQGSDSSREVVQIFNSHRTKLYATEIAVPTMQRHAPAETEIVFAERRHSQPEALWKWYYPGLRTGHEFLYPAQEEMHLRRDAKVVALTQPLSSYRNAVG